jgi:hypothetical protein
LARVTSPLQTSQLSPECEVAHTPLKKCRAGLAWISRPVRYSRVRTSELTAFGAGRPAVRFATIFPSAGLRLENYRFFFLSVKWLNATQRQRAISSGNRQILLLRPRRRTRRAPTDRAARFIDDRSDSVSGRFSISTTRGQHHVPSSTLFASCVTKKHRAAWR